MNKIDRLKETVMEGIEEISNDMRISNQKIESINRALGNPFIELNNVGIIVGNKIREFTRIFNEHNRSFFLEQVVFQDVTLELSNPIGNAITDEFTELLMEAVELLFRYQNLIAEVIKGYDSKNPLIKAITLKKIEIKLELGSPLLSDSQSEQMQSIITRYKEIEHYVFKYSLENDLLKSLIKYINKRYQKATDFKTIQTDILPTLHALGLDSIFDKIKETYHYEEPCFNSSKDNKEECIKESMYIVEQIKELIRYVKDPYQMIRIVNALNRLELDPYDRLLQLRSIYNELQTYIQEQNNKDFKSV